MSLLGAVFLFALAFGFWRKDRMGAAIGTALGGVFVLFGGDILALLVM